MRSRCLGVSALGSSLRAFVTRKPHVRLPGDLQPCATSSSIKSAYFAKARSRRLIKW